MKNIGLYLHIPFCASKCPYCDFYSFRATPEQKDAYIDALILKIKHEASLTKCKADTLYIGGGTPSLLGAKSLVRLVNTAKSTFLTDGAEITVECNPYGLDESFFAQAAECGINRVSIGLQSADNDERKKLGRRGTVDDVKLAVENAKKAGIDNISLDVMLGVPDSTVKSLENTLEFCISQNVTHISCYILKIEQNTPFYKMQSSLNLPDDDSVADMYLFMCDYLEKHGIYQYEISNFAKKGYESRHNLKYWNCDEYLGLGAAAHSFINGRRFYYERSVSDFIDGKEAVQDGNGGDYQEYAMLRLRLVDGLCNSDVNRKFGHDILPQTLVKAKQFIDNGYVICDEKGIRLTRKGFLISNYIISELL